MNPDTESWREQVESACRQLTLSIRSINQRWADEAADMIDRLTKFVLDRRGL